MTEVLPLSLQASVLYESTYEETCVYVKHSPAETIVSVKTVSNSGYVWSHSCSITDSIFLVKDSEWNAQSTADSDLPCIAIDISL